MSTLVREGGPASAAPEPPPATPRRPKSSMRRDLQGIRGLGIIFVVVGHLWRWPPGVYAMLDMFFVLSGFLITGVLIDSVKKYGGISFAQFYLSRVRRLMPMAVLVVLVTIAATYLLYSAALGAKVAGDGIWALVFGINWHFVAESTNYFSDTSSSPLLHYWSLSVEEQFYLVWPAVLLVSMLVARRLRLGADRALVVVLGTITVTAFAYSLWHSVAAPTAAYFSTFDRVWEFGIGGLIAVARPQWARMPNWLGLGMSWVGVVGLTVAISTLTYGRAFPAPWGLPVVLLTGAVMAGGHARATRSLWVLDNPPMVYLGDISYSLYLWHLPVNILLLSFVAHSSPWYYVAAIVISLALAVASYHLVERPLRYAPALMTGREREFFSHREPRRGIGRGFVIVAVGCSASLLVWVALSGVFSPSRPIAAPTSATVAAPDFDTAPVTLTWQEQRVSRALRATHFPQFSPPLAQLGSDHLHTELQRSTCFTTVASSSGGCSDNRPQAARQAFLAGDSFATAWTPTVRAALEPSGWGVRVMTRGECPTWTLPSYVTSEGRPYPECAEAHRVLLQEVKQRRPDLVVLASASLEVRQATRKDLATTPFRVARDGLAKTLRDLRAAGARRIVVLGPPPSLEDLTHCVTRFGSPSSCVARPEKQFRTHVDGEKAATAQEHVQYVSTWSWFCRNGSCPGFVGRTPVTVDGAHLTVEYARSLAPLLRRELLDR